MAAPRRNIELKASDPDPERSLAVVLGLGARDRGHPAPARHVLPRHHRPPEAARGGARRRDAGPVRPRRRRRGAREPLPARSRSTTRATLCAALEASLGTLAVVEKERHLLLWQSVRIHLDRVKDLGNFVELEGVATADSDLADELDRVTRLTEALEIAPERILRNSYSDQVVGSSALVDAARAVMERAHAPYSRFRVGAALRAEDGSIHVGANVENAAYPQGQCAEASAIGALVASGRTQHHRGRGDLRRRRRLRAVRRLPPAAARVHRARRRDPPVRRQRRAPDARRSRRCCRAPSARSSCPGERSRASPRAWASSSAPASAAIADALTDATAHPVRRARGLPAAERRRPRRDAALRRPRRAARSRSSRAASTSTRAATRAAMRVPIRTLKQLGAEALLVTNAAGSLQRRGRPGPADGDRRPHQPARRQPAHRPQRRRGRPALPEPARRLRPGAARAAAAPPRGALRDRRSPRASTSPPPARPSRPPPRSARSARSARTRSGCLPFPR